MAKKTYINKFSIFTIFVLAFIIALSGCSNGNKAADGVKVPVTETKAPTAIPALVVEGLKEGDTIIGENVTVTTRVTDFILSDFRTKSEVAAGEGHIHLWLDTDVNDPKQAIKQVNTDPVHFDGIKPGDHTLTVQLVGADHQPISPVVQQVIHFKTLAAPSLSVLQPLEGATITGDSVKVSVIVNHFDVVDFKSYPDTKIGQGHVHLWLDTDPNDEAAAYKLVSGDTATFDKVAVGNHTLVVQLVGNDHKPIEPVVTQEIHFSTKVKETAAAPKAPSTEKAPTVSTKPPVVTKPPVTAPKPPATPVAKNYSIKIENFAFNPETLTIEAGSKLTFTNYDGVSHTVTAKDGSFDSGLFGKGETYVKTFDKPGTYEIYCRPHPFMKLTIIVK